MSLPTSASRDNAISKCRSCSVSSDIAIQCLFAVNTHTITLYPAEEMSFRALVFLSDGQLPSSTANSLQPLPSNVSHFRLPV